MVESRTDLSPEDSNDIDGARNSISNLLSEAENREYTAVLEEYDSLFRRLRNIAEEREHEGFTTHYMEIYNGANVDSFQKDTPRSEIQDAMTHAFKVLSNICEEAIGARMGQSLREDTESLDQLLRALLEIHEFFEALPAKLNADNDELNEQMRRTMDNIEELMGAIRRTVDRIENIHY